MELIEKIEFKDVNGIVLVTERYGVNGEVNFENTFRKEE